jgi:hypothetical protein
VIAEDALLAQALNASPASRLRQANAFADCGGIDARLSLQKV